MTLAITDVDAQWRDQGDTLAFTGVLGKLTASSYQDTDESGGAGTMTVFPQVLEMIEHGDSVVDAGNASGEPFVRFSIFSYGGAAATAAQCDSRVTVSIRPMRLVYLQQLWLETVDYIFNGVLGTILMQTAESARQLAEDVKSNQNALDVRVSQPTVVIPVNQFVPAGLSGASWLRRGVQQRLSCCLLTLHPCVK